MQRRHRNRLGMIVVMALGLSGARLARAEGSNPAEVLLRGGTIVDGTGRPGHVGDVLIRGDRIVGMGATGTLTVGASCRVIDANGLVVAPGFIDLHTHSDTSIVAEPTRDNRNYQFQGVTTIVTGNCGGGELDVAKLLGTVDKGGAGANVIHLLPQGEVREAVVGRTERAATRSEIQAMKARVERGMKEGAWGVSSGLIYVPSRYASQAELTELARVAAGHGGIYASHIRNEGGGLLEAVAEALAIGRDAHIPVHISHLKASGRASWGLTSKAMGEIEAARAAGQKVSADQYPYIASSTKLGAMVVPHWAEQGGAEEFKKIEADPVRGPQLRRAIAADLARHDEGASIRIARFKPDSSIVGKDLVAIGKMKGKPPLEVVIEIERAGGAQAISFGMSETDVRDVMTHDYVATASDGGSHKAGGADKPHPRSYGTFPRKFRYALDDRVMSLEAAVRSCSGLPAEILGLPDRGTLRVGAFADVVVFDPKTFRDRATFDDSTVLATGVRTLLINGVAVIDAGQAVEVRPGRALRRDRDGQADLVLRGRVWTGDPAHPMAEAVAVNAGRIVAVGSKADVAPYVGPVTRTIEVPFLIPGLTDAHAHLENLGASLEEVSLRGVTSLEEVARRVKARSDELPAGAWVVGSAFDQSLYPGGSFPDASTLDRAAPGRAVWIRRVDGHAGWASTEAMTVAGLTAATVAPTGGQILKGPDGKPTGIVVDAAMGLITRSIPSPTHDDLTRHIVAAQREVVRWGITGIHDAGNSPEELEAFARLDRSDRLQLRVYAMASARAGGEVAFVSRPVPPALSGKRLTVRSIKLYVDGAMGSRGALLFEPYSDDPGNVGLPLIDPKVLEATTVAALKNGWQVSTHAIGDKGNSIVLDAYAAARAVVPEARDPRLRIEHAQVVRKLDIPRFKALGVVASIQPSHASDDLRWADARLGPTRVGGAYAWRWFLDAGIPVAFGSDFPVEVVNPFYGIYAALTRQTDTAQPPAGWHPEHRLTIEEALRGFTSGAAYASFQEGELGIIKVGMKADLTGLDRDLLTVDPPSVLKTQAVLTVVDGEVVYRAKP